MHFRFCTTRFIGAAGVYRVRDDLGGFYLENTRIHQPVCGIHGSVFLIRGKIQNGVGWDSYFLAEDLDISLRVPHFNSSRDDRPS